MNPIISFIVAGLVLGLFAGQVTAKSLCQPVDGPAQLEFAGMNYDLVTARRCLDVESRRYRFDGSGKGDLEVVWRRYLGETDAKAFLKGYVRSLAAVSTEMRINSAAPPGETASEYVVEARALAVGQTSARYLLFRVVVGDDTQPMESYLFTYRFPAQGDGGEARLERSRNDWRRGILQLAPKGP